MQNIYKIIADMLLGDLYQKKSQGRNISKKKFDMMIESYKLDHEDKINKNSQINKERKAILKDLYNKTADNVRDYCLESLRDKGTLIE